MAQSIREYTACWVRHEPNLEIGMIQCVPRELTDVSAEIDRASKYDPEASCSLIERFCSAVNTSSDIDDRLMKYVVRALQALIQNNKINLSTFAQTLGIKSKSHRPSRNRKRDLEIFFEVREHMRSMSYEEACYSVSTARILSEDRIQAIYKDRRKNHLEFLKEMDEYSHEVSTEGLTVIRELLEREESEK